MDTGINRNIVECKEAMLDLGPAWLDVLIETLWNVKFYFPPFLAFFIAY